MKSTFARVALISSILFLMMFSTISGAFADNDSNWTFDIKVQVEPLIQVNPNIPTELKMADLPQGSNTTTSTFGWYNSFYSNVPFTKTFTGTNPASDPFPILARQERKKDGTGNGNFDRLSTYITFETVSNGLPSDPEREDLSVLFDAPTQNSSGVPVGTGWWQGGLSGPPPYPNPTASVTMGTPHDGEVWEKIIVTADRKTIDWTTDDPWYLSADAGIYACTVLETIVGQSTAQSSDAYTSFP
jgi:hypothetical protein